MEHALGDGQFTQEEQRCLGDEWRHRNDDDHACMWSRVTKRGEIRVDGNLLMGVRVKGYGSSGHLKNGRVSGHFLIFYAH